MDAVSLCLSLTPHGRLVLTDDADAAPLEGRLADRLLRAFEHGPGHGLLLKDADAPFAFLATYTTRLSAAAKAQHLPLGQALREYAGAANKEHLLSLLVPVQRASEKCPWLKTMVDAGEIFHPLRWTPSEVLQLLRDVPHLETSGVV